MTRSFFKGQIINHRNIQWQESFVFCGKVQALDYDEFLMFWSFYESL